MGRQEFLRSIRNKQKQELQEEVQRITTPVEIAPEQTIMYQINKEGIKKAVVGVAKKEDLEKRTHKALNTNIDSLILSFFSTPNKDKFLKDNADNIKDLENNDLQRFINIILPHM